MSFQEKSTWVILTTMIVVYTWYFLTVLAEVGTTEVADIDYQGRMLVTVLGVVVLVVIGSIVIAIASGRDADSSDERDKAINRYGEYVGGFVLTTGALGGLALAMVEAHQFWIANTILIGLVLSEITANVTKIVLYRRGVAAW